MNEVETIKPGCIPQDIYRAGIMDIEALIKEIPGVLVGRESMPLEHFFGDGCYIRKITMEPGYIITSAIHKKLHPYFVMTGEVSVLTEQGEVRIRAPYFGMTPAGTKRLLFIHKKTIWITVHVTDKTDLAEIEKEIIAETFQDFDREVAQ